MKFPKRKPIKSVIDDAIRVIGGPSEAARLLQKKTGFRFSRSTVHTCQRNGTLPFANHQLYARIIARAAAEAGLEITAKDLEAEVRATRAAAGRFTRKVRASSEVRS